MTALHVNLSNKTNNDYMRIDHIAMYVKDLEKAKAFFTKYFGAKSNDMYHNPRTGLKTYFLSFGDGSRLEIMSRPDTVERPQSTQLTGYIHISFSVGSRETVDSMTTMLARDGYETLDGPRVTGDGFYESCVSGPEGCLIEITE